MFLLSIGLICTAVAVVWFVWGDDLGFNEKKKESRNQAVDSFPFEELEWKRDKKEQGLKLTIVNSLSSDWNKYLTLALNDWGKSTSVEFDVVSEELSSDEPEESFFCGHRLGKIRVCNGFRGETGWAGINQVSYSYSLSSSNVVKTIKSSVAVMNDTYLNKASDHEKRYTACHEIGHGLSLGHRDVDKTNSDLGTCLDYTNNFAANISPDEIDFEMLREKYGEISNRGLRGLQNTRTHFSDDTAKMATNVVKNRFLSSQNPDDSFGTLVQETNHSKIYIQELGEGDMLLTQMLLV